MLDLFTLPNHIPSGVLPVDATSLHVAPSDFMTDNFPSPQLKLTVYVGGDNFPEPLLMGQLQITLDVVGDNVPPRPQLTFNTTQTTNISGPNFLSPPQPKATVYILGDNLPDPPKPTK
jgi:hypothetical protein